MTDTSIRVRSQTRDRLKAYAALQSMTQDEAIWHHLEQADAPELEKRA